ncbi:LysR family transcriptional regulator [Belnapia sp. T6]|uniref:LysR family transcriptional regulator n=1 Tax=Belnapia mucosa TaxID=2804532 RepID=A0ABS1V530_9PROT|nr:LysR family transcriptional regulator [Belnapia mucosa]MBL6456774.1 LysR family transcriptional regulator [Belnapia mucosa]
MDNRIGELQVFLRVVEAGSFSEAARQLLMTPSTISKLIARMEARLGVKLIERSTRHLLLTEEGRLLYERGGGLLADLEAFERELAQGAGHPGGTIRVNASVTFGTLALEPLLPAFWEAYPRIVVDLSLSDEIVDLYLDRTDVAIRIGPLPDSSLVARRIGVARRKIVASPAYLARHGRPENLADLGAHNCLAFNFRRSAPVWPSREGGRILGRLVTGTLLANNGETVRRLAVAGVGLARLADFHVRDDIAAGRLVELFPDTGDEEEIHALHLGGPLLPQRVRVFLDFMLPRMQAYLRGED